MGGGGGGWGGACGGNKLHHMKRYEIKTENTSMETTAPPVENLGVCS